MYTLSYEGEAMIIVVYRLRDDIVNVGEIYDIVQKRQNWYRLITIMIQDQNLY